MGTLSNISQYWLTNSIAIFLISLVCTGLLIPRILHVAFSKHLFDVPDARKIHKGLVPRLGGLAFVPVIFFSLMLMVAINLNFKFNGLAIAFLDEPIGLLYSCCALLMLYIVGMGDDLVGVRYRTKFFVQLICAIMLLAGGLQVNNLGGIFGIHTLPLPVSIIITILTVLLIVNAINLIDGIDGLASGLTGIALCFFSILFFMYGIYDCAMIAMATLGVVVSFFYFNVFGNANRYKKIFMGDTGSLTLGLILTCLAFRTLQIPQDLTPLANVERFVYAFSPLLVPCMDVVRVFVERIRHKSNPFLPDQRHLHHMVMACGVARRATMMIILLIAVIFIILNVSLAPYLNTTYLLLIDIAIYLILTSVLKHICSIRQIAGSHNNNEHNIQQSQ